MMTIITKYLSPTNTQGGRIKATMQGCKGISCTVSYPHELNSQDAHFSAVKALILKHGFPAASYAVGDTFGGYIFVKIDNVVEY